MSKDRQITYNTVLKKIDALIDRAKNDAAITCLRGARTEIYSAIEYEKAE
jgi:hypothetical protein